MCLHLGDVGVNVHHPKGVGLVCGDQDMASLFSQIFKQAAGYLGQGGFIQVRVVVEGHFHYLAFNPF